MIPLFLSQVFVGIFLFPLVPQFVSIYDGDENSDKSRAPKQRWKR